MKTRTGNSYDVIIGGSGLGGLLCGNILAREGMKVCILEKNHSPGGCLQTFTRKGISFATGVHYFGSLDPGQPLHRYWTYFGLTQALELERMNPGGFDIIGIGEDEYPLAMGFGNFIARLLPSFPGAENQLEKYIRILEEVSHAFPLYNLKLPGDHREERYRSVCAYDFFAGLAGSLPDSSRESLKAKTAKRLLRVLTGNDLLYGGINRDTPLHIPALISHSFISSAWRTVHGSDRIASHLVESFISMGGVLFTGMELSRIGFDGTLFSLETPSGESFSGKKFISGISPARTLEMMDPALFRKSYVSRIMGLKHTLSSFALYIVLKERSFRQLDHNYYYHVSDEIQPESIPGDWPVSYMLHTPSPAADDGFAKSMIILAPVEFSKFEKWQHTFTGDRGNEYLDFRKACAGKLLDLVEKRFPGIRSSADFIEISTPLTWRDYTGTPGGAMYGIERNCHQPLETAILPVTRIPGFYFTGQNSNLHGVMGVTIGAVLTCSEILGMQYLLTKIKNS